MDRLLLILLVMLHFSSCVNELQLTPVSEDDVAPVLGDFDNKVFSEGETFTNDFNDGSTGQDVDGNGDALTYQCFYDSNLDGVVLSTNACSELGASFSFKTGELSWFIAFDQAGSYEFKITVTDAITEVFQLFRVSVLNTPAVPVLDDLSSVPINEAVSYPTLLNASDSGDDFDADGLSLSYACEFDTVVDDAVVGGTNCNSLPGSASFVLSSGVLSWTPDYASQGSYEIKITATNGSASDFKLVVIAVNNINRAPVLDAIADETIAENAAIIQVNAGYNNTDFDIDGDSLTYTCTFEQTINGTNDAGSNCSSLPGTVSFTPTTGVFDWTPDYSAAGSYEVWISASDGLLSDEELIVYTVTNTNRAPVLDAIANETIAESAAIIQVNADYNNTDFDIDGDPLTYSCTFEQTINSTNDAGSNCSSLPGTVSFTPTTGVFDWTPNSSAAGAYEVWIIASDGILSDEELIVYTVTNTPALPALTAIGDQSVNEGTAITQINANDGGNDFDADSNPITYQCKYDLVVDGAVSSPTDCTTIPGLSFTPTTGVFDWTPDQQAHANGDGSGRYEFKIIATSSNGSGEEIFIITTNQIDVAPSLASQSDEAVIINTAITSINNNDSGDDFDADGDAITCTCSWDAVDNDTEDATNACSLNGFSFNTSTGVLSGTPDATGVFEFQVTGSSSGGSASVFFTITVSPASPANFIKIASGGGGTPAQSPAREIPIAGDEITPDN